MSDVYSWENISEEVFQKEYDLYLKPDSPKVSTYYNCKLVINMEFNKYKTHLQNKSITNKQRVDKRFWMLLG